MRLTQASVGLALTFFVSSAAAGRSAGELRNNGIVVAAELNRQWSMGCTEYAVSKKGWVFATSAGGVRGPICHVLESNQDVTDATEAVHAKLAQSKGTGGSPGIYGNENGAGQSG